MYYAIKDLEISAAHQLKLSYDSPCENLHGHNWHIKVCCRAEELNADGMVIDFTHIKKAVKDVIDHKCLNDTLPFNPTAENIARWVVDSVPNAYRCEVQESAGNTAIYER